MDQKFMKGSESEAELQQMIDHLDRAGICRKEVMKTYDIWAPNYDKDYHTITYNSPKFVAEETSGLYSDKKNVHILDACSGTGKLAQILIKDGFCHIDALDGSAAMLEEAKKKNLYEKFYHDILGANKLKISDNVYDAVVTSGSFLPGHVKDDCYEEIIRILKPGGYFVVGICEKYFASDPEWAKNIEPHMKELEDQGKWIRITRKKVKDYMCAVDNFDGVVFVFKKV